MTSQGHQDLRDVAREREFTEKMIAGMLGKLAGHSMFAEPGSLDRLKMCADCRVIDLLKHQAAEGLRNE